MNSILKMGDNWLIQAEALTDVINTIYELCEIDKKKEIILKIETGHHVSIKIKEEGG